MSAVLDAIVVFRLEPIFDRLQSAMTNIGHEGSNNKSWWIMAICKRLG